MAMNVAKLFGQRTGLVNAVKRNFGVSYVLAQASAKNADPIQQLFVTKLREYDSKKKFVSDFFPF